MLPSIDTEDRPKLTYDRILIRICSNLHIARLHILDQPRPPTSLDACECRIKLLLERIQAAIALVDRLAQRTRWWLAAALACRRQVLPEQAVVQVASAVEVDQGLESDRSGDVILGFRLSDLFAEVVEGGYVGVVVVFMVEFHYFAGDGGFEGAVVVCGLCQQVVSG